MLVPQSSNDNLTAGVSIRPFRLFLWRLYYNTMEGLCVVCCEPIGVFCLGQCDHRSMCMTCGLRLRQLFGDTRCPVCKVRNRVVASFLCRFWAVLHVRSSDGLAQAENPVVLFTGDVRGDYKSGVAMCRAGGFDSTLDGHFASRMLARKAELLLSFTCPLCFSTSSSTEPVVFASLSELKDHISTTHGGRTVCDVCFSYGCLPFHGVHCISDDSYNIWNCGAMQTPQGFPSRTACADEEGVGRAHFAGDAILRPPSPSILSILSQFTPVLLPGRAVEAQARQALALFVVFGGRCGGPVLPQPRSVQASRC
jgi:hypothetical protein